jgi:hypothetical protein
MEKLYKPPIPACLYWLLGAGGLIDNNIICHLQTVFWYLFYMALEY